MAAKRPDGPRETVAGPDDGPQPPFPLKLNGKVIKGFGRGSSELGIPTANIPLSGLSVGGHEDIESGVYYGWAGLTPSAATRQHAQGSESKYHHLGSHMKGMLAKIAFGGSAEDDEEERRSTWSYDKGAVYPMVMSIGYNPVYKNTVRSVEVHVMHHFEHEFYGSHMNIIILGFIRPEYDYVSKEKLIEDIKTDVEVAGRSLGRKAYAKYAKDPYLLEFEGKGDVAS
ncbi:hypothetical protein BAUCODRAFT_30041 [Baudoinia panamericana UAMH 10762]|uniref:Riboflavin kinase n=1 Tax=Baudoinia panamericana (strain UAMH 10762) TaxID=717646 RepID=M2MS41_BAUPA|nr:uncharacterized protein BAUCODRAFT_30041 [Baudoinia panamericana UAMH 10762]EMC99666.1 hypothetical protein BAUCODRAFT_30041 [Baudoinia panamericana UAMH 10762]